MEMFPDASCERIQNTLSNCNDVGDAVDILSNTPVLISSTDDDDDLPSVTADDVCNEVCTSCTLFYLFQ